MKPVTIMSEKNLQTLVEQLLRLHGWRYTHFRTGRTARGAYVTPLSGDKGYPDLTAVRDGELLFIELKTNIGRLSPEQVAWIQALEAAGQEVQVWRPKDLDSIKQRLARKQK